MRRTRRVRRNSGRPNGIPPEVFRRIIVYGLLILVLSTAMSSVFAQLTWLPATPDLMLGAVLAIALLDDRRAAAIVAVLGGAAVDALGGVGASLSPLLYLTVILTVGFLSEKMLSGFLSWLILLLPSLVLRAAFSLCGFWLYTGGISFAGVFTAVLLPEAISTLIFCLPIYWLVVVCLLPIKDRRDRVVRQ